MSPGTAWPQGSALAQGSGITVPELAAEALGSFLTTHMSRRFGSTDANLIEDLRLALECIGKAMPFITTSNIRCS